MTKPEKGDVNREEKQSSKISLFPYFCILLSILGCDEEVQEGYSFPNKLSPHNSQKLIQSNKKLQSEQSLDTSSCPSSWEELSFQVTTLILNQKLWEKNLREFERPVDRKVVGEVNNPGKEAAYMK